MPLVEFVLPRPAVVFDEHVREEGIDRSPLPIREARTVHPQAAACIPVGAESRCKGKFWRRLALQVAFHIVAFLAAESPEGQPFQTGGIIQAKVTFVGTSSLALGDRRAQADDLLA